MKLKPVKSTTPEDPSVEDAKTAIQDKPAQKGAGDEADDTGDSSVRFETAVEDKSAKDGAGDEEEDTDVEADDDRSAGKKKDADVNAARSARIVTGKAEKVEHSSLSSKGNAATSSSTSSSSSSSSSSSLGGRRREDFVWQTTNLTDEEHDQLESFVQQLMHIGYTYNGCTWNSVAEDSSFQGWGDVFVWIGVITHKVFEDFFNGRDTRDFYLGTHTEIRRLEAWLWDVEDVHFVWAGLSWLEIDRRLGLLFALLPTLAAADKRVCVCLFFLEY